LQSSQRVARAPFASIRARSTLGISRDQLAPTKARDFCDLSESAFEFLIRRVLQAFSENWDRIRLRLSARPAANVTPMLTGKANAESPDTDALQQ
jgi:hypothetical protein